MACCKCCCCLDDADLVIVVVLGCSNIPVVACILFLALFGFAECQDLCGVVDGRLLHLEEESPTLNTYYFYLCGRNIFIMYFTGGVAQY